jgi:hypothetical protein
VHPSNIDVVSNTNSVSTLFNDTSFILWHPENISLNVIILVVNLTTNLTVVLDLIDISLLKSIFLSSKYIKALSFPNSLKESPNILIFCSISSRFLVSFFPSIKSSIDYILFKLVQLWNILAVLVIL